MPSESESVRLSSNSNFATGSGAVITGFSPLAVVVFIVRSSKYTD